jgi:hypothetical protein
MDDAKFWNMVAANGPSGQAPIFIVRQSFAGPSLRPDVMGPYRSDNVEDSGSWIHGGAIVALDRGAGLSLDLDRSIFCNVASFWIASFAGSFEVRPDDVFCARLDPAIC